jgi:hypothetical protein
VGSYYRRVGDERRLLDAEHDLAASSIMYSAFTIKFIAKAFLIDCLGLPRSSYDVKQRCHRLQALSRRDQRLPSAQAPTAHLPARCLSLLLD